MLRISIGENAGKVWRTLSSYSELNIKELKELTKLNDNDLHLALGWLSKENKVFFFENNNELKISLIE